MSTGKLILINLTFVCWALFISSCENSMTDQAVNPDPQFLKIYFYYGFGNELNTFEQTYTKDLVQDGYITVRFWLTEAEQESIRNKLDVVNFFSFPDTLIYQMGPDSIMVRIEPDPGWQFLRVADENRDKIVYWRPPLSVLNEPAPCLIELINLIIGIIEAKPEYAALPAAKGGRI